jgi:anti-anti-sigma factor
MALDSWETSLSTVNGRPVNRDITAVAESGLDVVITAAEGCWARMRLVGELDLATIAEVAEVTSAAIECGCAWVEIDVSDLRFCDSTGLRCLLAARAHCAAAGGGLRLVDPPPRLIRLLQITGLGVLMSATVWTPHH